MMSLRQEAWTWSSMKLACCTFDVCIASQCYQRQPFFFVQGAQYNGLEAAKWKQALGISYCMGLRAMHTWNMRPSGAMSPSCQYSMYGPRSHAITN